MRVLDFIDKFASMDYSVILKLAFERGVACWVAPFNHVVWLDINGTVYDVCGKCDYGGFNEKGVYLIPIDECVEIQPKFKDLFKQLGENECDALTKEGLVDVIKTWCSKHDVEYY